MKTASALWETAKGIYRWNENFGPSFILSMIFQQPAVIFWIKEIFTSTSAHGGPVKTAIFQRSDSVVVEYGGLTKASLFIENF